MSLEPENKINPVRHMLTGGDNETYDLARVLGAVGVLAGIIFQGYIVFTTGAFDILNYGTGFAALLTGMGAAIKIKETTEPQNLKS